MTYVLKDYKRNKIVRKIVRAANAIIMLDTIMQNPKMQAHTRTMLWQVVQSGEY
jgi:uncharacterized protein (UPF0147 family)